MNKYLAATALILLICPAAWAWEHDGLRLQGKLIGRYQIQDEERKYGRWTDEHDLHRARFDARWEGLEGLRLQLELELTGGVRGRDIYVRYQFHKAFKVWVGNIKKPFSRLRLTSRWDLLIPHRGLLDNHVIRKTMYGGYGRRDAGLMFSGRVGEKVKLRYFVGMFDGDLFHNAFFKDPDDPLGDNVTYRDYVARVHCRIFRGLVLGVNYNHKRAGLLLSQGVEKDQSFNLVGGDIRLTAAGFRIQLEGAYGDNPNAVKGRKLIGGHAIASYRIKLGEKMTLTPAFMFEILDPDDGVADSHAMRLAGALNLDIGEHARIILSAEGGMDELIWEVPEYVDPDMLNLEEKGPIEVPTRIILQANFAL